MGWSMQSADNEYPLIILIVGCLSIFASLIVVLLYIFNKNVRSFSTKMIACICASDIAFTLGIICNNKFIDLGNKFYCNASAFLTIFGSLSSISWGSIIAYTVYLSTKSAQSKQILHNIKEIVRRSAVTYAYFLPFAFAVVPLFLDDYINMGDVCTINLETTTGYIQNIILVEIPLFVDILVMFYFIVQSVRAQQREYQQFSMYLLIYPTICVIAFGSFFVQKTYELVNRMTCECDYDWHSISFILCAMNGFLNALFYGLNSSICFPIKNRLCCCCCIQENNRSAHVPLVNSNSQTESNNLATYLNKTEHENNRSKRNESNFTSDVPPTAKESIFSMNYHQTSKNPPNQYP